MTRRAPGRFASREHELLLPFDLRRTAADVVHSPAQDPPRRCSAPWIQTVHDVVPLTQGTAAERRRWRRAAARIGGADAVIAVSRWSADTAIRQLGLDAAKVHVIRHGVDARFRAAPRDGREPYVLLVGEYDPRKRHHLAFEVVAALAERGLPHRLVVAGRIAPWYAERMHALVAASPRPDRVELTGYVDAEALVRLYQQAAALIVTSSAEGFGFPAAEAMACATPVVAFDNSAVAEIVANERMLVADADVSAMVDRLHALLKDEVAWQEASEAAAERARAFDWDACVAQHVEVFRAVAR